MAVHYVTSPPPGGKSAVLTAITVALGGKAAVTGRGSGLKSFIKEGKTSVKHVFLVILTLNQTPQTL